MTSRFITLKQILKTNISIIKRCKFNKIAKKALSITIIVLTLFTQMPANNNVYADEIAKPSAYTLMYNTTYENTELNFENELLKAQVIDWEKANTLIKKGETFKVIDPKTKTTINLKRTGGHNHIDVETLTKADTDKLKMVWGGFSWEKKAMLIVLFVIYTLFTTDNTPCLMQEQTLNLVELQLSLEVKVMVVVLIGTL